MSPLFHAVRNVWLILTDALTVAESLSARLHTHSNFSKVKFQARHECPGARQIRCNVQRVQPIIVVSDIEHSDPGLDPPLKEAIPGKGVELPKIVAGPV